MERDPRSFLWDARESAAAIRRFIGEQSLDDYLADDMLRAAVERGILESLAKRSTASRK